MKAGPAATSTSDVDDVVVGTSKDDRQAQVAAFLILDLELTDRVKDASRSSSSPLLSECSAIASKDRDAIEWKCCRN